MADDNTPSSLTGQVVRLSLEQYGGLTADIRTACTERDAARADLATARAELTAARDKAVTAISKRAAACAERDAARAELATARAERDAARDELTAARAERDAARADVKTVRAELEQARAEHIRLQMSLHLEIDRAAESSRLLSATFAARGSMLKGRVQTSDTVCARAPFAEADALLKALRAEFALRSVGNGSSEKTLNDALSNVFLTQLRSRGCLAESPLQVHDLSTGKGVSAKTKIDLVFAMSQLGARAVLLDNAVLIFELKATANIVSGALHTDDKALGQVITFVCALTERTHHERTVFAVIGDPQRFVICRVSRAARAPGPGARPFDLSELSVAAEREYEWLSLEGADALGSLLSLQRGQWVAACGLSGSAETPLPASVLARNLVLSHIGAGRECAVYQAGDPRRQPALVALKVHRDESAAARERELLEQFQTELDERLRPRVPALCASWSADGPLVAVELAEHLRQYHELSAHDIVHLAELLLAVHARFRVVHGDIGLSNLLRRRARRDQADDTRQAEAIGGATIMLNDWCSCVRAGQEPVRVAHLSVASDSVLASFASAGAAEASAGADADGDSPVVILRAAHADDDYEALIRLFCVVCMHRGDAVFPTARVVLAAHTAASRHGRCADEMRAFWASDGAVRLRHVAMMLLKLAAGALGVSWPYLDACLRDAAARESP